MKHKKRVLITLPSLKFDPGGVAAYYNALFPFLKKSEEFTVEEFEIGSTHSKNKFFHFINDQFKFIIKILTDPPDIIHINPSLNFKSFIRDGLFVYFSKTRKIKVIIFFRGWEKAFEKRIKGVLKLFFNLTYKKADCFLVLASDFKETLGNWHITKPIHISTTTVNESLLKDFSISKRLQRLHQAKPIRVLFLSRLERKKGVLETIEAIRILLDKKINISLSIAGDGRLSSEIDNYIALQGLKTQITMLGDVRNNEKIKAFTAHDIYCFPTYYDEGMPNSVLEAMAFGLPVITTPTGGTKDFFINGKMGYLCKEATPVEIADNLLKTIVDVKKMCDISKFNYTYARKHFYAAKVAENLITIYKRN